jgi:hypothetical protein
LHRKQKIREMHRQQSDVISPKGKIEEDRQQGDLIFPLLFFFSKYEN